MSVRSAYVNSGIWWGVEGAAPEVEVWVVSVWDFVSVKGEGVDGV